jgi:dolichol-phosphate mannosyltransferase
MIWIFLPAYNEEIALPITVRKFVDVFSALNRPYRILVFDDGSSDRTRAIAQELSRQYPVEARWHEKNAGLGQTMIDGFNYLAEVSAEDDIIISLDCDDTHEPKFAPAAIEKLERDGYDLVVLSRFQKGGGQEGLSGLKTLLSMGAGIFLKILFPVRGLREYSCNYRVYRASIIKKAIRHFGAGFIRLAHMGFVATPEVLIKLRMIGAKISEVPFVLRYDQKPTKSKNNSMRTIRGYFELARLYWCRKA